LFRWGQGVLIWHAILDTVKDAEEKKIVFISNNTRDFASEDKKMLHSDLLKEAQENKVEIKYYNSINSFIQDHTVVINAITKDWIEKSVDIKKINDEVQRYINENKEDEIKKIVEADLNFNERVTGFVNVFSCNLSVQSFYIYEKIDGAFYVNVSYYLEYEAEVEIEKETEEEGRRMYLRSAYNSTTGEVDAEPEFRDYDRTAIEYDSRIVCSDGDVTYGITFKNNEIVNVGLESVFI
jgi:hypothetical protein